MKKFDVFPYHTAFQVCWQNGIEEINDNIVDESRTTNPEKAFIKKEAAEALSKEARDIISIVLKAPQEIVDSLYSQKYKRMSKTRVKQVLLRIGWEKPVIDSAFKEIAGFVEVL